jgi:hypothetical protein
VRSGTLLVVALGIGVLSAAGVAVARGGHTIAAAPDLVWERSESGGGYPVDASEFFRLPMEAGNVAILEYGPTAPGTTSSVFLELYAPEVTDATLPATEPLGRTSSSTVDQMRINARRAGRWILRVRTTPGAAYTLQGFLLRRVVATLSGPRQVRAGRRALLRGSLTRAPRGTVSIQFRMRRIWTTVGTARLRSGSFAFRARFPRRGMYLVRAVYSGDRSHRAAVSKVLAIRAV